MTELTLAEVNDFVKEGAGLEADSISFFKEIEGIRLYGIGWKPVNGIIPAVGMGTVLGIDGDGTMKILQLPPDLLDEYLGMPSDE